MHCPIRVRRLDSYQASQSHEFENQHGQTWGSNFGCVVLPLEVTDGRMVRAGGTVT